MLSGKVVCGCSEREGRRDVATIHTEVRRNSVQPWSSLGVPFQDVIGEHRSPTAEGCEADKTWTGPAAFFYGNFRDPIRKTQPKSAKPPHVAHLA